LGAPTLSHCSKKNEVLADSTSPYELDEPDDPDDPDYVYEALSNMEEPYVVLTNPDVNHAYEVSTLRSQPTCGIPTTTNNVKQPTIPAGFTKVRPRSQPTCELPTTTNKPTIPAGFPKVRPRSQPTCELPTTTNNMKRPTIPAAEITQVACCCLCCVSSILPRGPGICCFQQHQAVWI
jgi:hypothetical protein